MEHHTLVTASLTKAMLSGTTADGQFGWGGVGFYLLGVLDV